MSSALVFSRSASQILSIALRLGIDLERMHLTLKQEATKPAAKNFLQQQGRFDQFVRVFNDERPHQGINMRLPADLYTRSLRPYAGQKVGVKQVEEKIWLVSFMRYDLGFFDHQTCRIESAQNPFAAKVLAVSMGRRNTGAENIRWGLPVQGLPWPCVQLHGHSVQLGLADIG